MQKRFYSVMNNQLIHKLSIESNGSKFILNLLSIQPVWGVEMGIMISEEFVFFISDSCSIILLLLVFTYLNNWKESPWCIFLSINVVDSPSPYPQVKHHL